jgi:hypothetical protein
MVIPSKKFTAQEKGDSLERAVRAIEDSILRLEPDFKEGVFRIESKKVVRVEGVRHEIDLHVTAAHSTGYEATFIFECKNWEAKVGKNEIIVFPRRSPPPQRSAASSLLAHSQRTPRLRRDEIHESNSCSHLTYNPL